MESEIYLERIKCTNCGFEDDYNIPKGTRISEYRRTTTCPKCGCKLGW